MHTQGHSHLRIPCVCTHTGARISARYACTHHARTRPNTYAHSRTCTGKDTAVRARSSYGQGHRHPHAPVHVMPADPRMRTHSHTHTHVHTLTRTPASPRSTCTLAAPCPASARRAGSCPGAALQQGCPPGRTHGRAPLPCLLAPFWLPAIPGTLQPPRGAVQSTKTPQPGRCSQQHGPPGDFAEENHAETLPGPRQRLAPLCTKPSRGAGLRPPPASLLPQPGGGQRATPQLRFPS